MIKTAEEIRKITKITPSAKAKRILKNIEKELIKCAKNGQHKAVYKEYDTDQITIQSVMVELQALGYRTSRMDISDPRENDGYCVQLTIRW